MADWLGVGEGREALLHVADVAQQRDRIESRIDFLEMMADSVWGAGVPDGAGVNLSLVKLPADALMFPAVPAPGRDFDFARPRDPWGVSKSFRVRAKKLGFAGFTFHMMRHTHSTMLLDNGMPVHRVAARIGDDPATLLRVYARLTKKKSTQMSEVVNALGTLILGPN